MGSCGLSRTPARPSSIGKTVQAAQHATTSSPGLNVNEAAFLSIERLAGYEIANALLSMQIDLKRSLGLRAEEQQVFLVVVLATVQRLIHAGQHARAVAGG
jgi:hypothetical protein